MMGKIEIRTIKAGVDVTEPVQLEAGKYYKMKRGEKIYIMGQDPFSEFGYFIGVAEGGLRATWAPNGINTNENDHMNIISEWPDETIVEGWQGFARETCTNYSTSSPIFPQKDSFFSDKYHCIRRVKQTGKAMLSKAWSLLMSNNEFKWLLEVKGQQNIKVLFITFLEALNYLEYLDDAKPFNPLTVTLTKLIGKERPQI